MRLCSAVLLAALIGAGLAACPGGSPTVSLAPPARPIASRDYPEVRERWTRSQRVLKALDTPLRVYATLFSPEFVAAYLSKQTAMFRLTPAERAELARRLRDDADGGFLFFVSAASHEWKWIDFEKQDSVWRIALANPRGGQVRPTRIELERKPTATTTELFPYVTEFYHTYTFRFPPVLPDGTPLLKPGDKRLTLLFSGPLGRAELVWNLQ
jgi:hypothetical protein